MTTLKCIICTKQLEPVWPADQFPQDKNVNQPWAGTTFHSEGQYGSTIFDPMDGSFLEINICDDCLKLRESEEGFILRGTPRRTRREVKYERWMIARVDE